jgi:hypothetical protein
MTGVRSNGRPASVSSAKGSNVRRPETEQAGRWAQGRAGHLLSRQHAYLAAAADDGPGMRGKRASPARLCLCAPRRADRTSGAVHLGPRGHKPRVPMIAFRD